MGIAKVTNNATTTLAGSLTNVATSFTVATGDGAKFPNPSGSDYFYVTLSGGNGLEIVKCTARAGDVFTVTRAQDGTTAKAYGTGEIVELRPVAALFARAAYAIDTTDTVQFAGLGIGVVPSFTVHIAPSGGVPVQVFDSVASNSNMSFRRANGTGTTTLALNDQIGVVAWRGHDGVAFSNAQARIDGYAAEAWTATAHGTYLTFYTTATATTTLTERMRLDAAGNLLIGADLGQGRRLQIRVASGGTSGFQVATNDYAIGTTGTSLFADLGAASGNTPGKINVAVAGGSAAGNLVLQDAFGASNVGIGGSPSFKFHVVAARSLLEAATEQFAVQLKYNAATNGVWLGNTSTADTLAVSTSGGGTIATLSTTAFSLFTAASGNGISVFAPASATPTLKLFSNNQVTLQLEVGQGFALTTDNIGYVLNRANADLILGTNVLERLRITSDGRFYGTALHNNAGAVTGTANQYIASGTYTPTLTNVANTTVTAAHISQWVRIGNVVRVSTSVSVTPTIANSGTTVNISLPIASTLATAFSLNGSGSYPPGATGVFEGATVVGVVTTNVAQLNFYPSTGTAVLIVRLQFQYEVL